MRLAFPLLAAVVIAGCGQQRTVLERPQPETWTDRNGIAHSEASSDVVAPVYDQPQRTVYLACLRAARAYFNGQDLHEQPPGRITLHDVEWNAGNMDVVIDIVALSPSRTRVEMMTEGYGMNPPMAPASSGRRRMRNYLQHVDLEVRTLAELTAELAQPTSAGLRADDAATGATSRP